MEHLEVMADGWCGEAQRPRKLASTRAAIGSSAKHAEDLQPGGIGDGLDGACERFGIRARKRSGQVPAYGSGRGAGLRCCGHATILTWIEVLLRFRPELNSMEVEMWHGDLPVVVIGAGPVGLATAAHLLANGLEPLVLEAGPAPGASVAAWGHVRLFTPWRHNIDAEAALLLARSGWRAPAPEAYPTGHELVENYLRPLADSLRGRVRTRSRIASVSRFATDKARSDAREDAPFELMVETRAGLERVHARGVVDASGTYGLPNPVGASGVPAPGELAARSRIAYGIPNVLGDTRQRYHGRRVLVVGSGHSAQQVVRDLLHLRRLEPKTQVIWALRRDSPDRLFGADGADPLPERARLGSAARAIVASGEVELALAAGVLELRDGCGGIVATTAAGELPAVDEIIAATGFRPDLSLLAELRLAVDPTLESAARLAPLIDPATHSCGSVAHHGAAELAHPEANLYVVGMKSYGRAPTFLMSTGYQQVRSVARALAGKPQAEVVAPAGAHCGEPALGCGGRSDATATCAPPDCERVACEPFDSARASRPESSPT